MVLAVTTKMKNPFILLLILLLVQTIVFLATTIQWKILRHRNSLYHGSKLCVPCQDLLWERERDAAIQDYVARLRTDDKEDVCCGETTVLFSLMTGASVKSLFFDYNTGSPLNMFYLVCGEENLYSPGIPEARVVGVVDLRPANGDVQRIIWNKNGNTTTKGGLMHLELEGELFIRKPGKYFVAVILQLTSNESAVVTSDENVNATVKLSVLSHYYGYARVVLEEKQSVYFMSNYSNRRQFGAMFEFHEYDRISVLVSHPQFLVRNSSDNYMFAVFHE